MSLESNNERKGEWEVGLPKMVPNIDAIECEGHSIKVDVIMLLMSRSTEKRLQGDLRPVVQQRAAR
jgi:hypothetical protein